MLELNSRTSTGRGAVVTIRVRNGTVEEARVLRARIAAALDDGMDVVVDLGGLEDVDLTLLQLLTAAFLDARASRLRLTLVGPLPQAFERVVVLSGAHRQQEFGELLSASGLRVRP